MPAMQRPKHTSGALVALAAARRFATGPTITVACGDRCRNLERANTRRLGRLFRHPLSAVRAIQRNLEDMPGWIRGELRTIHLVVNQARTPADSYRTPLNRQEHLDPTKEDRRGRRWQICCRGCGRKKRMTLGCSDLGGSRNLHARMNARSTLLTQPALQRPVDASVGSLDEEWKRRTDKVLVF